MVHVCCPRSNNAGWNAIVRNSLPPSAVTLERTTQQIVIRFPAYPDYEVMSPETITLTLPGSSVKSGNRIFVAPAFRIRASSGGATLAGRVLQRLTEEERLDRIRTRPNRAAAAAAAAAAASRLSTRCMPRTAAEGCRLPSLVLAGRAPRLAGRAHLRDTPRQRHVCAERGPSARRSGGHRVAPRGRTLRPDGALR